MYYSVVSIIVIVMLSGIVARIIYGMFKCNTRGERVAYIRNFKKGKFLAIYPMAIPIYLCAYIYDNGYTWATVVDAFFQSLSFTASLVGLKFSFSEVRNLMQASVIYTIAIYYCYTLVLLNALLFLLSLFYQYLWERIKRFSYLHANKAKYLIIGNNNKARSLYDTITNNKMNKVALVDQDISSDCMNELFGKGVVCFGVQSISSFVDVELKRFWRREKKKESQLYIYVCTEDDGKNITICESIVKFLDEAEWVKQSENVFKHFTVEVFENREYESLYEHLADKYGCIRLANEYKQIARNFVQAYPMSLYLDESMIDYQTSCLRSGVDINVIFVGFGEVNQEIMKAFVTTHQFMTQEGEEVVSHPVKYHIFDKVHAEYDKNLNYSFFRYEQEFYQRSAEEKLIPRVDIDAYLPLPELPAEEHYNVLNVNNPEFYQKIRSILQLNPCGINYIIVSYGTDLNNMDLARKLLECTAIWNLRNKVCIFSRSRTGRTDVKEANSDGNSVVLFGNQSSTLWDMCSGNEDRLYQMTLNRHKIYSVASNKKDISEEEKVRVAEKVWYLGRGKDRKQQSSLKYRESGLYQVLSLRNKLLMMGMDYVAKDNGNENQRFLSEEEYIQRYDKYDEPHFFEASISGKEYRFAQRSIMDICKNTRANLMARQEHLRWNAYMIANGFVPATRAQIDAGKVKDYSLRYHANLTTYDGLIEYRQIMSSKVGKSEEDFDVIVYDYQILEDAWWILNDAGYGIIEKKRIPL